ncbi:cupin domain-containing protein [Paenibacillus glycanilyticus]|uniref:Cupin type-2 domain-containing protein n=1 Tax=Paenibacillus glycanilyticus TaxID=126569 RepID=A0ABQ6GDM0_9BACL|nr:cupin domain-containing protein [Paenibacillus glycanilyticus]GLX68727.1 hypothetical protein MU1_30720 [Paenibacillus glycanilyticus]
MEQLRFLDGKTVTFLERGNDERGAYLRIEHNVPLQGGMNAPHWHPLLTESFQVKQGVMKGIVDGAEIVLGAGECLTVYPKQVHQFFNISHETLIGIHEIRPPGFHWEMFVLHRKLESEGKLSRRGIPIHPLWMGLAWKYSEGFAVGAPVIMQKVLLGGLARIAERFGYGIENT